MGQNQGKEDSCLSSRQMSGSKAASVSFCPSEFATKFKGCFESTPKRMNRLKSSWRKHTLRQLNSMGSKEWAQLLVECLNQNNTEESDRIFQNEIFRSDFYCVNDTLHYTAESPLYSKHEYPSVNSLDNGGPLQLPRNMDQNSPKKVIFDIKCNKQDSQSVKNLLESSDILDEKFFHVNGKDDWLEKSFEITSREDLRSGSESGNVLCNQRVINKNVDQFLPLNQQDGNAASKRKKSRKISLEDHSNPTSPKVGPKKFNQTRNKEEDKVEGKAQNIKELRLPPLNVPNASDSVKKKVLNKHKEGDHYKALLPYKVITGLITKHLSSSHNIFCIMINTFEEYFEKTYGEILNDLKNEKIHLGQIKEYASKATADLLEFVEVLRVAISLFYRFDQLKIGQKLGEEALFTNDNLFNFVASNVFTVEIYNIIFGLYQKLNLSVEGTFETNLKRYQSLDPKDFGVADDYCLDDRTIQLLKENNLIPTRPKNLDESLQTFYFETASPPHPKEGILGISAENSQRKNPYRKAIQTLKTLSQKTSPIHKLKVIVKLAEKISACIERFYKDLGVQEIKKIDSEQTLALFMYIIAQSGVQDITTHCRIIEKFTTSNILESLSGYYAILLEDAVNKICAMNADSHESDVNSPISEAHNTYT